jgi:hypothetical protein
VAHAWTECAAYRASIEEIGNLQLATIPPRVHSFKHLARPANHLTRLSNHLARLSNHLARLSNHLARLSNHLARLSNHLAGLYNDLAGLYNDLAGLYNDSINGAFDEKAQKLAFLAAGHANIWQRLGVLYFTNGAVCSAEVIPGGSSMIFMFRK